MSTSLIALFIAIAVYVVAIGVPLVSLVRYSFRRAHQRSPRRPVANYTTEHIAELLVASSAVSQSIANQPTDHDILGAPAAA